MRPIHAGHLSLLSTALALPLVLAGWGAAVAQDVVYVDDLTSPAAAERAQTKLPHLSRGTAAAPTPSAMPAARAGRMPMPMHAPRHRADVRGLSQDQVAQAIGAQIEAAQDRNEHKTKSLLEKLGDALKINNPFTRDTSNDSAPQMPQQRHVWPVETPGAADRVVQASHAATRGGLGTRRGDQRTGLFNFGQSPTQEYNRAPQARTAGRSTRENLTRGASSGHASTRKPAASSPSGMLIGDAQRPGAHQPLPRAERPLAAPTPEEPVFITDMDSEPTPEPVAANASADPGLAAPSGPLPIVVNVSDRQPTGQPKPPSGLTASTGPAPKPLVRPATTKPLVVDNPQAESPSVSKLELVEPRPAPRARVVTKAKPTPVTRSRQSSDEDTLVLPNPVEVAKPRPKASPRAVELLAEAHQLAEDAQTEQEFTRVVQQCRHVLAIDDSSLAVAYANDLAAWALNKRGEAKADEGRNDEAMADFNDAVRTNPELWRAVHNRGVLLAQAGDFSEAFQAFNDTIKLNAEFGKAYSNRASLYVQAGEFEIALADYKKAISLNPDLVVAHTGRGRVCHVLGQFEQALRHFDAATLLSPGDAYIVTCRADLLVDLGRYAEACDGYRHAIDLDPALASAYRNLAWVQATCPEAPYRDPLQALANAQKALEIAGEEDDICLDTLAAAQAAAGDYTAAAETIKRAIALAPTADQQEYSKRLKLYETNRPYRSEPIGVRQAGFQEVSDAAETPSDL